MEYVLQVTVVFLKMMGPDFQGPAWTPMTFLLVSDTHNAWGRVGLRIWVWCLVSRLAS